MNRHSPNGLAYFTFDSLDGKIVHAISTRHGGISPAPFDTLNLSVTTGDDASNVNANIARLHCALALNGNATVTASQAQADQIVDVGERGARLKNVDALITNAPNLPLLLRYADCVPIFLYDPAHRAIGVVHAGWRGTIAKIAAKTVQAMQRAYETRARDVLACIGPSIGPCCYAIGADVIARVRGELSEADSLLVQRNGSTHFDLW